MKTSQQIAQEAEAFTQYRQEGTFLISTGNKPVTISNFLKWVAKINLIETNETATQVTYDVYRDDNADFIATIKHSKKKSIEETLIKFQDDFRIRFIYAEVISHKEQYAHVYSGKACKVDEVHNNSNIAD